MNIRGLGHLDVVPLGKHEKPKKQVFPRTSFLMALVGAKIRTDFDWLPIGVPSRDFREPMLGKSTTAALEKLISIGLIVINLRGKS